MRGRLLPTSYLWTVVFFLAVILVAMVMVPLTRGSFHRLSQVQFRQLWVLLVALVVQMIVHARVTKAPRLS